MIGRNINTPPDSKQFCAEQIGIAVYGTLKRYGKITVRQISDCELFFIPEDKKHLQITDEDDQIFLFSLEFNWNAKLGLYTLKV